MMLLSVAVSLICSVAGLFVGTVVDVPCSAIIVIIMAAVFIVAKIVHSMTICRHR